MAIQLNERDKLIFSLLDEHKVLLEKHIAWFIASDQKPVLIRDRLRKLFYLDYLFCQRHPNTLPWWTTPTKPLVYTLSPLTRKIIGVNESDLDLNDSNIQRHLLEIANLRMLFLVAQNEALIQDFGWSTCKSDTIAVDCLDATVTFKRNEVSYNVGILNNPAADATTLKTIGSALSSGEVSMMWIVSRDEIHQNELQKLISNSDLNSHCVFATHQELYKLGIVKSNWQNSNNRKACIFIDSVEEAKDAFMTRKAATA